MKTDENKPQASAGEPAYKYYQTIVREHKSRLKHARPQWWPRGRVKQLTFGRRVRDNIVSVAARLAYDIDDSIVEHIKAAVEHIERIQDWRANLRARAEAYTDDLDFAFNGGAAPRVTIVRLDPAAVATLGPGENLTLNGGLLGWLIVLEQTLSQIPAYRDNQAYGVELGYIQDPAHTASPDSELFNISGAKLLDNTIHVLWKKNRHTGATFMYRELGDAEDHWRPAGSFYGSPSPVTIPPHPVVRDVWVIGKYLQRNTPVGNWSKRYRLTVPAAGPVVA